MAADVIVSMEEMPLLLRLEDAAVTQCGLIEVKSLLKKEQALLSKDIAAMAQANRDGGN
jgi:hypothetical protein